MLFYTLHHHEDQPEQEDELGQHKQAEPQRCRLQACVACSRAYLTSELSLKYVYFDNRNAVGARCFVQIFCIVVCKYFAYLCENILPSFVQIFCKYCSVRSPFFGNVGLGYHTSSTLISGASEQIYLFKVCTACRN